MHVCYCTHVRLCIVAYTFYAAGPKYLRQALGGVLRVCWQIRVGSAAVRLLDTLSNKQKIGLNFCRAPLLLLRHEGRPSSSDCFWHRQQEQASWEDFLQNFTCIWAEKSDEIKSNSYCFFFSSLNSIGRSLKGFKSSSAYLAEWLAGFCRDCLSDLL